MKKVWSSPSLVQCDLLKAMLEGEGISCVIQNESNARFAGIGYPLVSGQALTFAWPEVWVPGEAFDKATGVVRAFTEHHEATLKEDRKRLSGDAVDDAD